MTRNMELKLETLRNAVQEVNDVIAKQAALPSQRLRPRRGSTIPPYSSTAIPESRRTAHGINPSRDISPAPVLGCMGMYCRRGRSN